MTKRQAAKKLQRAENALHDHIYNSNGMMRAVLDFEKAYFESRKAELKAKVKAARSVYNSL